MKIRLIGSNRELRKEINQVVDTLDFKADIEELSENESKQYDIKYTPAILIENVLISDGDKLSINELQDVMSQFIEV